MTLPAPTVQQALDALRAAVEEKGADFVYHNPDGQKAGTLVPNPNFDNEMTNAECKYVHGSETGCIAGNAMVRLGIPRKKLANHENISASTVIRKIFADVDFNSRSNLCSVGRILSYAQAEQDDGKTWGEALAAAEKLVLQWAAENNVETK